MAFADYYECFLHVFRAEMPEFSEEEKGDDLQRALSLSAGSTEDLSVTYTPMDSDLTPNPSMPPHSGQRRKKLFGRPWWRTYRSATSVVDLAVSALTAPTEEEEDKIQEPLTKKESLKRPPASVEQLFVAFVP
eukprot:236938_1